jgi:hypothetical protein
MADVCMQILVNFFNDFQSTHAESIENHMSLVPMGGELRQLSN